MKTNKKRFLAKKIIPIIGILFGVGIMYGLANDLMASMHAATLYSSVTDSDLQSKNAINYVEPIISFLTTIKKN